MIFAESTRPSMDGTDPAGQATWRQSLTRRLWISDLIVLTIVVFGAQILAFGLRNERVVTRNDHTPLGDLSYWLVSAALVVVWLWALRISDSRSDRVVGAGMSEYAYVVWASFFVFGGIAIIAFLLTLEVARSYLLISLPAGVLLLLLERALWRRWLVNARRRGAYSARVLLVGSESSVANVAHELQRRPAAGYVVVGACIPSGLIGDTIPGTNIPVMGTVDSVPRALEVTGADTVAITSTDELPAQKVKEISWGLEAGRQHLVLAPSIIEIAGPRIHTRPVAGLPLIHVETPRFSGGQYLAKRITDLVLTSIGVILISPVLLVLTIVVALSSRGPIFFRQTRVGLGGQEFTMIKFRSMVSNAEELLDDLEEQGLSGKNAVLFKMKDDPRVTPIGKVMRKYSLDELPQLFNVLGGSMSLVGPRPPLPKEVELYADHVHRRFLAKPGITGPWQVGGRSTLSWEESVRLDLSYVENWSLVSDLGILIKTVRAVVAPGDTAH